jgi:hypothetical protein
MATSTTTKLLPPRCGEKLRARMPPGEWVPIETLAAWSRDLVSDDVADTVYCRHKKSCGHSLEARGSLHEEDDEIRHRHWQGRLRLVRELFRRCSANGSVLVRRDDAGRRIVAFQRPRKEGDIVPSTNLQAAWDVATEEEREQFLKDNHLRREEPPPCPAAGEGCHEKEPDVTHATERQTHPEPRAARATRKGRICNLQAAWDVATEEEREQFLKDNHLRRVQTDAEILTERNDDAEPARRKQPSPRRGQR